VVRLLNLRAGVRHHDWEIALSGTNLLNNTVRQSIDPMPSSQLASQDDPLRDHSTEELFIGRDIQFEMDGSPRTWISAR